MPTALLFSSGSRGDTEPVLALSVALLFAGTFDRIHICLQPEYAHLVPRDPRITTHLLPFTEAKVLRVILLEFFKDAFLSLFTGRFDPIVSQNRGLSNLNYYCIIPALPFLRSVTAQAQPDLIVSTSMTCVPAHALALHHKVPFAVLHLQPTQPTHWYPYMLTDMPTSLQAASDIARLHTGIPVTKNPDYISTYNAGRADFLSPSLAKLNDFREDLGLPRVTLEEMREEHRARGNQYLSLYAYSADLIPPDPTWEPYVRVVNPLSAGYIPPGWTPEERCPKTLDFLATGEKPFLVTFGSMLVPGRVAWVSRQLLMGLREAGLERVLLLKGDANLGAHNLGWYRDPELAEWAEKHVFFTDESPQYGWLMPHCLGVLCHGGAGTTFASLSAGLPTIIAPLVVDQFFWGRLVKDAGLGATIEPSLREAKAETYAKALKSGLRDLVVEKAAAFGEKVRRRGNGAKIAAEMLRELSGMSERLPA